MPTNKQRRDAARRHLERQLERRAQREAAHRRFTLIASIAGTIVIIGLVVGLVVGLQGSSGKNKHAAAGKSTASTASTKSAGASSSAATSPSPSASASYVATKTSGPCKYASVDPAGNSALKDVGMPPDPKTTPKKVVDVEFATNRGVIDATLDGRTAPCTVQAITYLIRKGFYDKTPCPRVVDSGIYVVQCGSGGDSTSGGPTFTIPDENLAKADYSAGAIAMANTGQPNSGSSQFFFITKDSNSGLSKQYTVFGHVTKGLDILQKVAAGGNDGSSGAVGGGAPKLSLEFTKVSVVSK